MNTPTPQAPLEYAGFWLRFLAFIIDSILVAIIIQPILSAVYKGVEATEDVMSLELADVLLQSFTPKGPADVLLSWVLPAVAIILFWIYRAATPGKMLLRAKIVDAQTGAPPSAGQCIGRYLGYYVSIFTLCLGFLWIAFDSRKQGFHDKLAGTVVVRTPRATFTPTQPANRGT
jgi:uncharacterized RDD family membrane protein YckC